KPARRLLLPDLPAAAQVPWHSVGTMLRLERHPFGPRVYVLRHRIHEYHLGLAVLAALAVGALFDVVDLGLATTLATFVGVWLVAKDWRDLVPSKRDSASWQLGLHRRAAPRPGGRPHACAGARRRSGGCAGRSRCRRWPRSPRSQRASSTSSPLRRRTQAGGTASCSG